MVKVYSFFNAAHPQWYTVGTTNGMKPKREDGATGAGCMCVLVQHTAQVWLSRFNQTNVQLS